MKVPNKDQSLRTLYKGGELCGKVKVPGDKSISHRALLFGSIAKGKTIIDQNITIKGVTKILKEMI